MDYCTLLIAGFKIFCDIKCHLLLVLDLLIFLSVFVVGMQMSATCGYFISVQFYGDVLMRNIQNQKTFFLHQKDSILVVVKVHLSHLHGRLAIT